MEKNQHIQKFILQKIKSIDESFANEGQDMSKLKLATMRISYAKIMEDLLKNQNQLPKSYYQQSLIYLKNGKIDQAISKAQLAKKKTYSLEQNNQTKKMSEYIDLLLIQCFYKNKKIQDALSLIQEIEISTQENQQKFLELKGKIFQSFENQQKSKQTYKNLYDLTAKKYGIGSLKNGLCLIEIGKNEGYFKNTQQGITLINQGLQILINHRYHNPDHVAHIYQTLAQLCKQIQDSQREYSALICAYAMIKQLEQNQQKRSIQVLSKLSQNVIKRGQKQKSLEFLFQIEQIQRKICGQSSSNLNKVVKKIISLLAQLNRTAEMRKYQCEYQHLIGSRVILGRADNSILNTSSEGDRKFATSHKQGVRGESRLNSISRVLMSSN